MGKVGKPAIQRAQHCWLLRKRSWTNSCDMVGEPTDNRSMIQPPPTSTVASEHLPLLDASASLLLLTAVSLLRNSHHGTSLCSGGSFLHHWGQREMVPWQGAPHCRLVSIHQLMARFSPRADLFICTDRKVHGRYERSYQINTKRG